MVVAGTTGGGSATAVSLVRGSTPIRAAGPGLWTNAAQRLRRDRLTLLAIFVLLAMILFAVTADLLAEHFFQYGFTRQNLLDNYRKPETATPAFWLGSDDLGRSQIVRLLYGARISLAAGFGAALINLSIGMLLGLGAGYFVGPFDDSVQFVVTTLNAIPQLCLLLIIAVLFTRGPTTLALILGLLSWGGITLFVRGQTLALREREFVVASRVVGGSSGRIMFSHLLPNILPLVIVLSAIDIGGPPPPQSPLSLPVPRIH